MWFRVASTHCNGTKHCRGTFLSPIPMLRDCNRHLLRDWREWWKKHRQSLKLLTEYRQHMRLLKKRDR